MVVGLDLQSFLLRARVLKLYRQALRISGRAPGDSRDSRSIGAAVHHLLGIKCLSNVQRRLLHEGPDTIDELLDRHLVKNDKKHLDDDENEYLTRQRLTSTRREALSLYRDIHRATRFFMWPDSRGVLWRDILRENARKEFEESRFEKDPEVLTRLLIGGREAVQAALDKLVEKQKQQLEKERNESRGR